ncbi:hypothetical protein [Microvirga antarctica]|uniref:hypothetical protein n=1 Tax=Microvirga antarctica TaxID=2819233 RepID=UPI001B308B3C|nr:hypothetical protein [Microvirga antarctica]
MIDNTPHAFNVFCRRDAPDIRCAVPEERPVPVFLEAPVWEFTGRIDGKRLAEGGFGDVAVAEAIRAQGYYIFQRFRR